MLKLNPVKIITLGAVILVIGLITLLLVVPSSTEIGRVFSSQEAFKEWINSLGIWAPLVYLLVQTGQVLIAPIPGNITGLVGGAAFGWWWGFVLSGIGMIAGSLLAFYLGRWIGRSFAIKLAGEANYQKYSRFFTGNFSWVLLLIFLVPFLPDDILCILAGLSSLTFSRFLILVLVGRLPSVMITNLVGAGLLTLTELALTWWVWVIAGLVTAGVGLFYWLNRARLSNWLERKMLGNPEQDKKQ